MKPWLINTLVAVAGAVILIIATTWLASGGLQDSSNHFVGRPPLDLQASNITYASGAGVLIHGWLVPGKPKQGVVVLLHTVRADRREMISRAEFLRKRGYAVLMIDFQSHGENRGHRITYGDLESRDVTGAIQYLHHKLPGEKVAVLGVQMGADAFVLSEDRPAVDAVVLEQMYPTIDRAIASRVRSNIGPLAPLFSWLVMLEMQSRQPIPADRLNVIGRLPKINTPVLIVNGTDDSHTTIEEARAEFAAAVPPKELWEVKGAGHVNLHDFAPAEYERRVGDFIARYLPPVSGEGSGP
ncbi:MAG: alpha/beta fold hydrolase [Proteobacteria bacterium]|nr:alpha/beta fold hydrolase [Pseudomonadota bacterium]